MEEKELTMVPEEELDLSELSEALAEDARTLNQINGGLNLKRLTNVDGLILPEPVGDKYLTAERIEALLEDYRGLSEHETDEEVLGRIAARTEQLEALLEERKAQTK